jgi:hypothetical protein
MKRNLSKVLAGVPRVVKGVAGVSAAISAVNQYIRKNDLMEVGSGLVDRSIASAVGVHFEAVHYSPGGIKRRASYREAMITGMPEFEAVKASAPDGLKAERGLMVTAVGGGKRRQWSVSGGRWAAGRALWSPVSKESGALWVRGRRRLGRYAVEESIACGGGRGYLVTVYAGAAADTRARTVVSSEVFGGNELGALRQAVRKSVVGPVRGRRSSVAITARLLGRLCPEGWAVEVSPASVGAAPAPAFRELSTGEVYHFPLSYSGRCPVAEARVAFERRAAARDQAELAAVVERGEAAGVWVCAADSYRAGNCRAGTASFAARHGLDVRRHYRAGEVSEAANGDIRFVRAAVVSALRRERREVAEGVCKLAEHRAD